MTYLLDTNVISEWAKPARAQQMVEWLASADEYRLFLSMISIAEVSRGIKIMPPGAKRDRLMAWLTSALVPRFAQRLLPITMEISLDWGTLMAQGRAAGRPIGSMDAFIAATARLNRLTLVTRNIADFRDREIAIFYPWDQPS